MSLKTDLDAWIVKQKTVSDGHNMYLVSDVGFDELSALVKANSAAARRRRAIARRDKAKADLTKTD